MSSTSNPFRLTLSAALPVLAFVCVAGAGAAFAETQTWELDPAHSAASFSVRHLMVSQVRGHFENMTGTVELDEKNPAESTIEISIDAASINTRNDKRDEHLRSADFFDAAKHPKITFKSTRIARAGKGKFKVTGDLSMRGTTKAVTLVVTGPTKPTKSPFGQTVRGVTATGTLDRKDWGLTWNKGLEAGGVLVGDEVELQIDAELVAKASTTASAE